LCLPVLKASVCCIYTAVSIRGYVFTVLNVRRNKTSECRVQRCRLEIARVRRVKMNFNIF
jgi:hypothetical protein